MTTEALPTRAEDMFCFGIYTTSHLINRAYTPHLAALGLTYPQYIVLVLLWERDEQRVTELAATLKMGTNTLTPLIKRLETMGFVTRARGKKDGREVLVSLTPTGRDIEAKAPEITACMIEGTGLKRTELEELQRLLFKLAKGFS